MKLQTIQILVGSVTFAGMASFFTSIATSPAPQSGGLITFVAGETAKADDVNQNFALLDSRIAALEPQTGGITTRYQMVRVEYWRFEEGQYMDTVCQLINTSSAPITVGEVWVLGRGGIDDIIATYSGLDGTTIPPFGRLDVEINSDIPGVMAQTFDNPPPPASNVVFGWIGEANALKLSGTIDRWFPGSREERALAVVEGFDVPRPEQPPR